MDLKRIGETKIMNCGEEATIIEYNGVKDILVEFKKYGEKVNSQYVNFKNGTIKSKFAKTVYGVGFIGECLYKTDSIQYKYWRDMLKRCYDEKTLERNPTYCNKSVDECWHNFQNFAKWFDENYYEHSKEAMCLDKDILEKGNKIYSPNTCIFVPKRINTLFVKCDKARGQYPIGVSYKKSKNKYQSRCQTLDGLVFLGYYNTPEEAFYKYKEFKEDYIKKVAEEYKDIIPVNLYEAMNKYVVDIND